MPHVVGLRSPYEDVDGLLGFGRTLDKIRLRAEGRLPEDYLAMLGTGSFYSLDTRSCMLLGVTYDALVEQTLRGGSDAEVLTWAYENGRKPGALEVEVSNAFSVKMGWRDDTTPYLKVLTGSGLASHEIATFLDYIESDEGRTVRYAPDPPQPSFEAKPSISLPGLRSPYDQVGGLVHFGRMLDKIKLHGSGALPPEWEESRGRLQSFDDYTCRFLRIDYANLEAEVLANNATDEEWLRWAYEKGRMPSEDEIRMWNPYLSKRCWRDRFSERVKIRLQEVGLPASAVLTMFDFIDLDEGRSLRF
jgi:gluconokinase